MYNKEILLDIPYSNLIIDNYELDTLTGVLDRRTICDLCNKLIDNKYPFTFMIVDIDNFKSINDNHGHQIGDKVLATFADSFISNIGKKGYIGRYGGDEFIILYLDSTDYDSIYDFLKNLYFEKGVLNKKYKIDNLRIFISATIGCSKYPVDSTDYDELFLKADKALYRGKQKGRNCFIIYLHEKHKNIDLQKSIFLPVDLQMIGVCNSMEGIFKFEEGVVNALNYICRCNMLYYAGIFDFSGMEYSNFGARKNKMTDSLNFGLESFIEITDKDDLDALPPTLKSFIKQYNIISLLIGRVYCGAKNYGYIIFAENKVERIWQESDKCLMLFISKLYFYRKREKENVKKS